MRAAFLRHFANFAYCLRNHLRYLPDVQAGVLVDLLLEHHVVFGRRSLLLLARRHLPVGDVVQDDLGLLGLLVPELRPLLALRAEDEDVADVELGDVPFVQAGALQPDRPAQDLELDVVVGSDHAGADVPQALREADLEVVAAGRVRADLDGLGVEVEGTNVLPVFDERKANTIGHGLYPMERSQPLVSPWAPVISIQSLGQGGIACQTQPGASPQGVSRDALCVGTT